MLTNIDTITNKKAYTKVQLPGKKMDGIRKERVSKYISWNKI